MIKRRQLLKNACAAGVIGAVPLVFGLQRTKALRKTNDGYLQRVKLNKGQTLVYFDPLSGRREQFMAVTDSIEIKVPSHSMSVLPVSPGERVTVHS